MGELPKTWPSWVLFWLFACQDAIKEDYFDLLSDEWVNGFREAAKNDLDYAPTVKSAPFLCRRELV